MSDETKVETEETEVEAPKKGGKKSAPKTVRKDMPSKEEVTNMDGKINRDPKKDKPKSVSDMGNGTKRKDY